MYWVSIAHHKSPPFVAIHFHYGVYKYMFSHTLPEFKGHWPKHTHRNHINIPPWFWWVSIFHVRYKYTKKSHGSARVMGKLPSNLRTNLSTLKTFDLVIFVETFSKAIHLCRSVGGFRRSCCCCWSPRGCFFAPKWFSIDIRNEPFLFERCIFQTMMWIIFLDMFGIYC